VTLWIVSPMLRDTESFVRLRVEAIDACATSVAGQDVKFLVVDDSAGTDPEVTALRDVDDVEVLTPPFNLGHQRAIVFGLRHLADPIERRMEPADIVVTMDSDGEDMPGDIPRLVDALHTSGTALAIAQRTKRSEPWKFQLMYVIFRTMFRILTGTTVRSGNFAAQRADSLAATIHHPSFDLCYSSTLLALGRPTVAVPCARGQRFAGASRMNTYSLMAHGIRMLMPFSERIAVRMLVVASATGAALAGFLVAYATGGFGDIPGPGANGALVALAVLFLASIISFVVLFSGFSHASATARTG
jgi:polyisoprenyl-phosphate glycosyltransferase